MPEKYKEQIEEILKDAENLLSEEGSERPAPTPRSSQRYVLRLPKIGTPLSLPRISAGNVMLAALSLFLLAAVLAATGGPVMLLVGLGIALFVLAYVMFFARPFAPRLEKRWRGRLVEDETSSLWARLKRWLGG